MESNFRKPLRERGKAKWHVDCEERRMHRPSAPVAPTLLSLAPLLLVFAFACGEDEGGELLGPAEEGTSRTDSSSGRSGSSSGTGGLGA